MGEISLKRILLVKLVKYALYIRQDFLLALNVLNLITVLWQRSVLAFKICRKYSEIKPRSPALRQILYCLRHQEAPNIIKIYRGKR